MERRLSVEMANGEIGAASASSCPKNSEVELVRTLEALHSQKSRHKVDLNAPVAIRPEGDKQPSEAAEKVSVPNGNEIPTLEDLQKERQKLVEDAMHVEKLPKISLIYDNIKNSICTLTWRGPLTPSSVFPIYQTFFKRRCDELAVRKHKLCTRWARFCS
eukprot:274357_1